MLVAVLRREGKGRRRRMNGGNRGGGGEEWSVFKYSVQMKPEDFLIGGRLKFGA